MLSVDVEEEGETTDSGRCKDHQQRNHDRGVTTWKAAHKGDQRNQYDSKDEKKPPYCTDHPKRPASLRIHSRDYRGQEVRSHTRGHSGRRWSTHRKEERCPGLAKLAESAPLSTHQAKGPKHEDNEHPAGHRKAPRRALLRSAAHPHERAAFVPALIFVPYLRSRTCSHSGLAMPPWTFPRS